jgi:uncharacterized membrane protein
MAEFNSDVIIRTTRLETFSDGVLAIILTIMVLEFKIPHEGSLSSLMRLYPVFISYVLSFIYIGIYWNNHHHLLHGTKKINGAIMWANLHLLFWLSLIPFVTGWMGENHFEKIPVACYGVVLLMCAIAYGILQSHIISHNGKDSELAIAIGKNYKGKISPVLYAAAIALSFVSEWIAGALYVAVALMWLIPDKRIEENVHETD